MFPAKKTMDEYLAENPLGQEAHATFALYGDALDPEKVTARLSITPDLARSKGQLIASRSGRFPQRTGAWLLKSQPRIQSTSLERHLTFLVTELEPHQKEINLICREYEAVATFICYWVPASFHGGPMLSSSIMRRIAALGASLWFDIYADLRGEQGSPEGQA